MENRKIKTALIDGYLDEPSCLGVPPYISPHIRYTYGALLTAGLREDNINYITIDQLRQHQKEYISRLEEYDLVVIIAGTTVPGHYLGGKPISLTEIKNLGKELYYPQKVLGGPITLVYKKLEGYDFVCKEIAARSLYQVLTENKVDNNELPRAIAGWAAAGARLTVRHPSYPELVCEIETFRGCPRQKHCAFCSERLKKCSYQRTPAEILREVKELARNGNHYYRLGCQTDLLLYQAEQLSENRFKPNPAAIERLYRKINQADPDLKVLHLDNINPTSITNYPDVSRQILKTIVKYNTAGDIAAFGLESADPVVLKQNNIESDPATTLRAVEIMNVIGGKRENGLPQLLPGINLLHGLQGERPEAMELNYRYLKKIYEMGLMLRRINIRQVVSTGNYPVADIDKHKFKEYKQKINEEINRPMLKRVFPQGTVIRDVLTETQRGKLTYGRQLGSYPILIGIPGRLALHQFMDVIVVDHGYRSLTALPYPFNIKKASPEQLAAIPGIGKKRANKIFLNQPENMEELKKLLNDSPLPEICRQLFFT
ncbi:MAG: radical SAM protein [Halanaerobiales bacterium]